MVDWDRAIRTNLLVRAQATLIPHLLLAEEEQGGQGQREEEAQDGRDLLWEVVVQAGRARGQQAEGQLALSKLETEQNYSSHYKYFLGL